jgi:hypothetical protein
MRHNLFDAGLWLRCKRAAPADYVLLLDDSFEDVSRARKPDGMFLVGTSFFYVARPKRDRRSLGAPGNESET